MLNAAGTGKRYCETCIPTCSTKDVRPPKSWVRVIHGCYITPRVINKTLTMCRDRNCDLHFIAQALGVGDFALRRYMETEKSVPEWIAERFYGLFSADARLPIAPPEKPQEKWAKGNNSGAVKRIVKTPDVDAERLAQDLSDARKRRGLTIHDVAAAIDAFPANVRRAESGKIRRVWGKNPVLIRLCDFYGFPIRNYETKPRIDYRAMQKRINGEKNKRGLRWDDVSKAADVSRHTISMYANSSKSRSGVVYLSAEMVRVMTVLGIDPNDVCTR